MEMAELKALRASLLQRGAQLMTTLERVERLKRELRQAADEEAAVRSSYRKHRIRYARAECLQLTKMMYEKLPAELRDLVYRHLLLIDERPILVSPCYHFRKYDEPIHDPTVDNTPAANLKNIRYPDLIHPNPHATAASRDVEGDLEMDPVPDKSEAFEDVGSDDEQIDFEDDKVILPDGRVKYDHSHKPPSDMILPSSHVLNPRYVGPAVAFDTQKLYYSCNTFSVCNVEGGLWKFLQTRLEPHFAPADYVRNLQIRIKFEHFRSKRRTGLRGEEIYAYERDFLRYVYNSLCALEQLLNSSLPRELNIEFLIMADLSSLKRNADTCFVNLLQAIRNTVYKAMHDFEGSSIKVTYHDDGYWPFPRNLTEMFVLTKEQWEHEKLVHKGQEEWVEDFYLAPRWIQTPSGGFAKREMHDLFRERWGRDMPLELRFLPVAPRACYPIKEGKYWPKGNPWPSEE